MINKKDNMSHRKTYIERYLPLPSAILDKLEIVVTKVDSLAQDENLDLELKNDVEINGDVFCIFDFNL